MPLLDWLAQHWLQAAGPILSAGALFFAWRNWARSMSFVTAELRPLTQEKWGYGRERGPQLTLPVIFRALRNDVYIAETFLIAGKDRVAGSTVTGRHAARLRVGDTAYRYWYVSKVRHMNPRKSWRIYWQDSEGRTHLAATVGRQDVKRLTETDSQI